MLPAKEHESESSQAMHFHRFRSETGAEVIRPFEVLSDILEYVGRPRYFLQIFPIPFVIKYSILRRQELKGDHMFLPIISN